MQEHTLRVLDFDAVRKEVESYAWSEEGKKRLRAEGFFRKKEEIERFRPLVKAFGDLYERQVNLPNLSFPDIEEILLLAEKPGAQLEGTEIARLVHYLETANVLKKLLMKQEEPLRQAGEDLPDLSGLAKHLSRYIDGTGALKEQQIPSLQSIGERIRHLRREIEKVAYSYIQNPAYRGYWQTDAPTLKDGRVVLPLNVNYRGKIRGILHEISSRGATLFMEPLEIFEKNNQLVDEENEYQIEVNRILRELSSKIHERYGEIRFLRELVSYLDTRQARARYGRARHCQFAAIGEEGGEKERGTLCLRRARHPLLGDKAVPVDIEFPSVPLLILSGPNTGGKTVALKTLGLLVLMNQYGMEIPASDSSLPLFDEVFVDIGDEQSLSESLSTFSAHIRNLTRILGSCTSRSLVLLDELGAGTDPDEGAALAIAFLLRFQERGTFLMGSTHLAGVKRFVLTTPGMMNASVEFDLTHMKPTYRILPGVPGPSYALEIAQRCGAPPAVLELARSFMEKESSPIHRLMDELSRKTQEYNLRLQELEELKRTYETRMVELEQKERELKLKELEIRERGVRELQGFLLEKRKELESTVRALREGELDRERIKRAQEAVREVETTLEEQKQILETEKEKFLPVTPSLTLMPGMEVRLRNHRHKATLLKKTRKDQWEVSVGSLKMRVPERDIEEVLLSSPKVPVHIEGSLEVEAPKWELDLRGLRAEEAIKAMERQIDGAVLAGLKEFSVIHGKGEGVLQQAIHDYLARCPLVEGYAFAPPEAGGTGKTIVRMK